MVVGIGIGTLCLSLSLTICTDGGLVDLSVLTYLQRQGLESRLSNATMLKM